MKIIVNGDEVEVPDSKCGSGLTTRSYDALVAIAGETGKPTVKYRWQKPGSDTIRAGLLSPGMEIILEPGMRFTIVHTGAA